MIFHLIVKKPRGKSSAMEPLTNTKSKRQGNGGSSHMSKNTSSPWARLELCSKGLLALLPTACRVDPQHGVREGKPLSG